MLFNSVTFLVFLPIFLLMIAMAPRRLRNYCLLAMSYLFYGAWDWRFLGLILISTLIDYTAAIAISASEDQRRRRMALAMSLVGNLGLLGTFMYFNFFVDSAVGLIEWLGWHASRPGLNLILPVGISFYTLQTMSYAIDVPQDASGDHAVFLRLPWWFQSPLYAVLCLAMMPFGNRDIPFISFQF